MPHRLHNDNVCVRGCKDLCHSWLCCLKVRCHSSIPALRQALGERKQELPRALCLKSSQFIFLHSLTRPRLLFGGFFWWFTFLLPCVVLKVRAQVSAATLPVHRLTKIFWEKWTGRFWLCYSYFLAVELTSCGSKAAERLPRGMLWPKEHCAGWMSDWYLQTAEDVLMAHQTQKNTLAIFTPDLFPQ